VAWYHKFIGPPPPPFLVYCIWGEQASFHTFLSSVTVIYHASCQLLYSLETSICSSGLSALLLVCVIACLRYCLSALLLVCVIACLCYCVYQLITFHACMHTHHAISRLQYIPPISGPFFKVGGPSKRHPWSVTACRSCERIFFHNRWNPVSDMSAPRPTLTAYRGV
jgi:hypothetical protein